MQLSGDLRQAGFLITAIRFAVLLPNFDPRILQTHSKDSQSKGRPISGSPNRTMLWGCNSSYFPSPPKGVPKTNQATILHCATSGTIRGFHVVDPLGSGLVAARICRKHRIWTACMQDVQSKWMPDDLDERVLVEFQRLRVSGLCSGPYYPY